MLEARTSVYGPEVAAIDSLTRTGRAGTPLRLERRGEAWWLTQPYEWPANPNAIARVLNELRFLKHETSFAVADLTKSGQTLADYGLGDPVITFTFVSSGKSYVTQVGDDTKIGNRLYLLSPDAKTIHVVGRSLADSIDLPLDQLRTDSIFTVPVFEVRSLTVQTPALKVRLRRDAASRWAFESPISTRAGKAAVEVTINALNALTAKTFLEPAATDLERTGLSAPAFRVTLEGNARRETLLIGNPVPVAAPAKPVASGEKPGFPEYYAKIEDKAVVFTVPLAPSLVEVLHRAQEALRDHRVLDFEPRTVTALSLSAPGQPELTLQRLEASQDTAAWQLVARLPGQAPQTSAADTGVVEELLQKLAQLSKTEFLSDAPSASDLETYGFNRPEREFTLNLSTGGGLRSTDASTLTLQIGTKPGEQSGAYARVANAPFIYRITSEILAAAPVRPLHYRQRLVRELPAGARIHGVTLTDTAAGTVVYSRQLNETSPTWDQAVAAEPEARRRAIGVILTQLHTLRARQFTTDTFNPDHADTAQGPQPWLYRIDLNIAYAGGNESAQNTTSTLFLTGRLGGNTQLAGTTDFGGVTFEISQELLDALFTLTYREKNDPGLPAAVSPAVTPPPAGKP
jgi:Domain of unknown function (DUF4340)